MGSRDAIVKVFARDFDALDTQNSDSAARRRRILDAKVLELGRERKE